MYFDGNNRTISGLDFEDSASRDTSLGLFSEIPALEVSKLQILGERADLLGPGFGYLVGSVGKLTASDIHVEFQGSDSANSIVATDNVGSLAGTVLAEADLQNVSAYTPNEISSSGSNVGGLIG